MRSAGKRIMFSCTRIWLALSLAHVSHAGAQTLGKNIEIAGISIKPGVTLEQALMVFKGPYVSQGKDSQEGMDRVTISTPKALGAGKFIPVIVGTLHVKNGIVVSACRNWDPQESTDSELARMIFSALTGGASSTKENATVETSITRGVSTTVETVFIHMEGRTVTITRQEDRHAPDIYGHTEFAVASVEECVTQPGWNIGPIAH
jgi:hypothetical protein